MIQDNTAVKRTGHGRMGIRMGLALYKAARKQHDGGIGDGCHHTCGIGKIIAMSLPWRLRTYKRKHRRYDNNNNLINFSSCNMHIRVRGASGHVMAVDLKWYRVSPSVTLKSILLCNSLNTHDAFMSETTDVDKILTFRYMISVMPNLPTKDYLSKSAHWNES